ncbi:p24 family protein gamma-4 [Sarotherodon galilaeus]
MSCMEETYTSRRAWISKDSPTAAEIFRVPTVFGHTKSGNLQEERRISFYENGKPVSFQSSPPPPPPPRVLTHLLPPVGASRCSLKSAITHLLDFALPGTSIASFCSDPEASSPTHQPQLICISDLKSATRQYIIVAKNDKVTIPLNEAQTCVVDKLFKLYWVCNLSYPALLVFTFFEFVYDLPLSTQRKTKVLELIAQIKACK